MGSVLFAMAISQSPGLPVTLATACTPGMCLLVLPVIVSRKPRDSRVVQKSLSGEKDKKTPNVLK